MVSTAWRLEAAHSVCSGLQKFSVHHQSPLAMVANAVVQQGCIEKWQLVQPPIFYLRHLRLGTFSPTQKTVPGMFLSPDTCCFQDAQLLARLSRPGRSWLAHPGASHWLGSSPGGSVLEVGVWGLQIPSPGPVYLVGLSRSCRPYMHCRLWDRQLIQIGGLLGLGNTVFPKGNVLSKFGRLFVWVWFTAGSNFREAHF